MGISVPVSVSRLFCGFTLCLALLAVSACSNDPSEPPDRDSGITEPETTEPEPEPETTEPEPEPEPETTEPETTEPEPEPEPETTEPGPEPEPEPEPEPQGSVPESVVGVWCGGRNDAPEGHWTYAFDGDGAVAAENAERGGFSGYVVTQEDVMTFYWEGMSEPVESTWAVGYEEALGVNLLFLDGFSYYPGSCNS